MQEFANQSQMIKRFLEEGNTISGMVALDKFGCWSLPRRICDIKETGFPIESQWVTTDSGKRIKEYWMGKDQQELSF